MDQVHEYMDRETSHLAPGQTDRQKMIQIIYLTRPARGMMTLDVRYATSTCYIGQLYRIV
ncbi:MAG: hypothetical protein ACOC6B_05145 [Thermodesulfobacteriota bacterium]